MAIWAGLVEHELVPNIRGCVSIQGEKEKKARCAVKVLDETKVPGGARLFLRTARMQVVCVCTVRMHAASSDSEPDMPPPACMHAAASVIGRLYPARLAPWAAEERLPP